MKLIAITCMGLLLLSATNADNFKLRLRSITQPYKADNLVVRFKITSDHKENPMNNFLMKRSRSNYYLSNGIIEVIQKGNRYMNINHNTKTVKYEYQKDTTPRLGGSFLDDFLAELDTLTIDSFNISTTKSSVERYFFRIDGVNYYMHFDKTEKKILDFSLEPIVRDRHLPGIMEIKYVSQSFGVTFTDDDFPLDKYLRFNTGKPEMRDKFKQYQLIVMN